MSHRPRRSPLHPRPAQVWRKGPPPQERGLYLVRECHTQNVLGVVSREPASAGSWHCRWLVPSAEVEHVIGDVMWPSSWRILPLPWMHAEVA